MQILVISLRESVERRQFVTEQFEKAALQHPWQFLDAVRGSTLTEVPKEYKVQKTRRLLGYELTPSELGCFLSHKKAWQMCVDSQEITVILEDDFLLLPEFSKMMDFLSQCNDRWGMVRLNGLYPMQYSILLQGEGCALVKNHGDAVGSAAYVITPEFAKRLLDASTDIYEPLDHFLEHYKKHHTPFLAVHPYPIGISGAESTIQDRPGRAPIMGFAKLKRSLYRALDRMVSPNPWFPK